MSKGTGGRIAKLGRRNTFRDGTRRRRNGGSENTTKQRQTFGAETRDLIAGKKPGIGTFERKIGDRVYDPAVCPDAFWVTENLGVRPAED